MENLQINNVFELMDCIRDWEPYLIRYIMDFLFIPCSKGNYKYIRVLPKKGTKSIHR